MINRGRQILNDKYQMKNIYFSLGYVHNLLVVLVVVRQPNISIYYLFISMSMFYVTFSCCFKWFECSSLITWKSIWSEGSNE